MDFLCLTIIWQIMAHKFTCATQVWFCPHISDVQVIFSYQNLPHQQDTFNTPIIVSTWVLYIWKNDLSARHSCTKNRRIMSYWFHLTAPMICAVALNLGCEENNLKVESGMKQVGEKKAQISSITFLLPILLFF